MGSQDPLIRAAAELRAGALAYPEAYEDFPWGHSAFKVKGKAFLFTSLEDGTLRATVKLPLSNRFALTLPFATPTGYGLARSGWVTAQFRAGDDVPVDRLLEWVDESYRAVAPKRLVARLDAPPDEAPPADYEPPASKRKRRKN